MAAPRRQAFARLDTLGTGAGSSALNVNGSVTPVNFKFIPEARRGNFRLSQLQLYIRTAADLRDPTKFGTLAALTNGINLSVLKQVGDTLVQDFFLSINATWPAEGNAKSHSDLRSLGFAVNFSAFTGASQWVSIERNYVDPDSSGSMFIYNDEYLRLKVNDDLSTLTVFNSFLAGVYDK